MAFERFYLTNKGADLLAKAQIGEKIEYTKVQIGNGTMPDGSSATSMTALVSPLKTLQISSMKVHQKQATIRVNFTNQGLDAFWWMEVGLFANDPTEGEILYAYANAGNQEKADYIPAILTEFAFEMIMQIENAINVTAIIDDSLVYVSRDEMTEELAKKANANHNHDTAYAKLNHVHPVASITTNGFLSATDKKKLNGVAEGANKYVHPTEHPASMITQDGTHRFVSDTEKSKWNGKADGAHTHVATDIATDLQHQFVTNTEKATWNSKANGNHTHSNATDSADGFMSKEDKKNLDALPGKYVQLTNLTQLTEQNLTLETLNPGNYYALSAVANTFADKPEGVTLTQSYVTVYWDFWTTGNTTKRIELISRGDGRKWYKSYNGTEWGNWIEYTRNEEIADKTKLTQYINWTDLGVPVTSDYATIVNAMVNNSVAILPVNSTDNNPNHPTNYGALEIFKTNFGPVQFTFTRPYNGFFDKWCGTYRADLGFSGWKKLTYEGHNHNSFTPKDVSGQTLDIQDLAVETPEIEWFRCGTNGGAANISNIPVANLPFFLEKKVVRGYGTGNDFIARFRFLSSNKKEYECWCTVSTTGEKTWTDWQEITLGGSETGSWTPVFRGTTTAGSFTYTDTNEGYYFKVGGYVYIHGKIGVSNVAASPAGAYEVTGLPYSGTPWGTNGITVGLANGGQDESMRRITSGSVQNSVIRFRALTAGNTQQWEASSTQCPLPVGGAFELYFSGWYRTEE